MQRQLKIPAKRSPILLGTLTDIQFVEERFCKGCSTHTESHLELFQIEAAGHALSPPEVSQQQVPLQIHTHAQILSTFATPSWRMGLMSSSPMDARRYHAPGMHLGIPRIGIGKAGAIGLGTRAVAYLNIKFQRL